MKIPVFVQTLAISIALSIPTTNGSNLSRRAYGQSATSGDSTAASSNSTSSGTVATACFTNMCISGSLNGSNVQYELSATGGSTPGWMAIGFGTQMVSSPMVIFWSNSDGMITMSQRQASGHIPPDVVNNPPRVASLVDSLSSASGSTAKYTFTIPSDGNTSPDLIWAYSPTNPGSSSADASIVQHSDAGSTRLNLVSGGAATSTPLRNYEKLFIAHAILCVIGFLLLLPAGALVARYFRTFTNGWFRSHWIIQVLGGVIIILGIALGIQAVSDLGGSHFSDTHQKLGLAAFILYFVQVLLGVFIHKIKLGKGRRPPQNYLHAILGLAIIAIAMAQVRSGYRTEWPKVSGRGPVSNGANIIWYVWVVLLPALYFVGLAFLPKQLRQEAASRQNGVDIRSDDEHELNRKPQ
ncbi:hypothetical protein AAF712_005620 [Marasmius tenuissimus]|uniref:CBD9-like protein n=1 Tax=Marasmius tenuissimus TaxID=585030 RepID=A0ABR3A0K6_9AGAR